MCKQPFDALLDVCMNLILKMRPVRMEKTYTVHEVETVAKTCEKREMTFWRVDNSSTGRESQTNITLNIEMFTCPFTKMNIQFLNGSMDLDIEDFYITEGLNALTFGVLRNSTSSSNICLSNLFKLKFSKKMLQDFLKNFKENITSTKD